MQDHKICEVDWPNKNHVYEVVHWVAVVRAVEGVVFLEIEQFDLSHLESFSWESEGI